MSRLKPSHPDEPNVGNPLVLQTTARFLFALFLLFSIFLLLRGHNQPGGGFSGGLVGAAAFALYAIAFDAAEARRALRVDPRTLIAVGLLVAAASAVLGLLVGEPFMTGLWTTLSLPIFGDLKVGTPLLFDVGVYIVVIGITLLIVLTMEDAA
jgi:multicomponent Na+:H+ antiporter subunit B